MSFLQYKGVIPHTSKVFQGAPSVRPLSCPPTKIQLAKFKSGAIVSTRKKLNSKLDLQIVIVFLVFSDYTEDSVYIIHEYINRQG